MNNVTCVGRDASGWTWRRGVAGAAAVAAVALVGIGCGAKGATSTSSDTSVVPQRVNTGLVETDDAPVMGGKIVYGINAETNGWNPGTNQWAPAGLTVMRTFFDTMTAFDQDSVIKPYAGEFTHNDDYSEWYFTLRPNMVFHNGKPVNAAAVARDQNYMRKSPVTKQAYPYTTAVEARDELTVVFKESQKWVTFPQVFATQVGVISDPDWLESNDGIHPIGSGPFAIDSWQIGNKLTVKKNPNYWQKDAAGRAYPYLDEIEFRIITDNNSRSAALEAGDVDIIEASDPQSILRFQEPAKLEDYQVFSNSKAEMSEVFIMLNNKVAPFDDVNARRALAFATDKPTGRTPRAPPITPRADIRSSTSRRPASSCSR